MANQHYIYTQTERQLWTVGYYSPAGFFQPEKDFGIDEGGADAAAKRVAFLNGGGGMSDDQKQTFDKANECLDAVRDYVMTVEPSNKESEEIRDELYSILKNFDYVP